MPRVISFIVLLAIILLVGAVFFQVMAQFIVPLFLASVLLVVFQPMHGWILGHLPRHPRICALVTTVLILLAVLLPLVWLGWNAYVELHSLFPPARVAAGAKPTLAAPQVSDDANNSAAAQTVAASPKSQAASKNVAGAKKSNVAKNEEIAFIVKVETLALKLRDDFYNLTKIFIEDPVVRGYVGSGQNFLASKALSGVQSVIGILVGLAIMVIALYYFLADGPAMIDTVMDLSPLDYRYEQELLERFGSVSRAVVVATLLSAAVQGILAGFGYYFALSSGAPIFLLTAVTMVTAMVPFVGAAFTWVCVCGYVYLYGEHIVDEKLVQGDPTTAIILAIYCTVVVSGIDNVIKPFILHGQSKLHPLLALLSILGGVQVLGPVGILVGPMLVSFLQALLNMLRKELDSFGGPVVDGSKPLAESVADAMQMSRDENAEPSQKAAEGAGSAKTSARQTAKTLPAASKPDRSRRPKRKR